MYSEIEMGNSREEPGEYAEKNGGMVSERLSSCF